MFIFGNLIYAIAQVLDVILTIMWWVLFVRAIISWVNPDPYNPIVQFLYRVTEPILEPIRKLIPPSGIDFSVIVAFLAIILLRSFLIKSLFDLAFRLR